MQLFLRGFNLKINRSEFLTCNNIMIEIDTLVIKQFKVKLKT